MSTFKEQKRNEKVRVTALTVCLKHPCIFQFIQCFAKYAQAPGLHNFLNPRENEILQQQ